MCGVTYLEYMCTCTPRLPVIYMCMYYVYILSANDADKVKRERGSCSVGVLQWPLWPSQRTGENGHSTWNGHRTRLRWVSPCASHSRPPPLPPHLPSPFTFSSCTSTPAGLDYSGKVTHSYRMRSSSRPTDRELRDPATAQNDYVRFKPGYSKKWHCPCHTHTHSL